MSADACRDLRGALVVWGGSDELPEPLARHLSACAACRSAFDERFPPAIAPNPVPAEVRRRVMPSRPSPAPWLAAAAAALAAVGVAVAPRPSPADELAELVPPQCVELPEPPPECPVG